ncbi:MAG: autotransporter domain-containing protein [Elusimicrobia bacterium]|nr:autotransporter domain-containing protein [Elusimicrobiota bacterium]
MNRTKQNIDSWFVRAICALALACSASSAGAQLLATTARQSSSGSLKFLGYYQGVQDQTLNFSINDSGACSTQNGLSFSCGGSGNIAAKGSGGAGMLKAVWQPWERFQYYAMVGAGDYSMSVPSATVTNVYTGDNSGRIYGAGLKASIVPDTIVAADGFPTPAISLDVSMTRSQYDFNRRNPMGAATSSANIAQRLTLMTYQFAVEASHLFPLDQNFKLEPYGGVKWTRVQADMKDLGDGSRAGGQQDTVSPFLGLRVPVEDHEAFFAEASFVDGYHYGAGLELRFK